MFVVSTADALKPLLLCQVVISILSNCLLLLRLFTFFPYFTRFKLQPAMVFSVGDVAYAR